jgi:DNA end-binding protein Ku
MPASKRAYWKGYLRLSLVTIGIEVFSATESRRPSLHQIHKPSGKRIRYQKIVPGVGPVDTDEIVKGFEVNDDRYVLLEPEEFDEIKLESKKTIDLVQFVDYDDIDPRYFERPFYVVPNDDLSQEGYLVIHRALKESRKIALGQMVLRGSENLVAIKPCGKGLLLETLRYADEVRASESFFDDIPDMKLDSEMIDLAKELVDRKSSKFDPAAFSDHYAEALKELVEQKRKGKETVEVGEDNIPRKTGEVIDLMEALKKSIKGGQKSKRKTTRRTNTKQRKAS